MPTPACNGAANANAANANGRQRDAIRFMAPSGALQQAGTKTRRLTHEPSLHETLLPGPLKCDAAKETRGEVMKQGKTAVRFSLVERFFQVPTSAVPDRARFLIRRKKKTARRVAFSLRPYRLVRAHARP